MKCEFWTMSLLPGWRDSIERLHTQNVQCVLAMTGGGSSFIGDLLSVPGGSNTILEGVVPYASSSLNDWLGRAPEQYCSPETALMMATTAYQRAEDLAKREGRTSRQPLGLGCTASLVSSRPKKGAHRCHLAVQTASATSCLSCELDRDTVTRDRPAEEHLVAQLGLQLLLRMLSLQDSDPALIGGAAGDQVHFRSHIADPLVRELFLSSPPSTADNGGSTADKANQDTSRRRIVWSHPDGRLTTQAEVAPRGVLSGAFNPLHSGHRHMREAAERMLQGPVCYELCIRNVDKPPLDFLTIEDRRRQFTTDQLALTNAPTFAMKSQVLNNVTFVVGVDTAFRIVQPKYYGGGIDSTRAALNEVRANGCRFLVAARSQEGRLTELRDIEIPAEFADLFTAIPLSAFREDISSTTLRRQRESQAEE